MLRTLIFFAVALSAYASLEQPASPFASQPQSLPQLLAQEEFSRRLGDFMLGMNQAQYFQQYAMLRYQAFMAVQQQGAEVADFVNRNVDDISDDSDSYGSPPVVGIMLPTSMDQYNFNAAAADRDFDSDEDFKMPQLNSRGDSDSDSDSDNARSFLEFGQQTMEPGEMMAQSTMMKLAALKFTHMQVATMASDVEKSYWMNRILQSILPPQMMMYKLYKNYLSAMALSFSFQVHDAFTLEAHLEHFNNNWGAGSQESLQAEAMAEMTLYTKWSSMCQIKLYLFYMSMMEKMMMQRMMQPQGGVPVNPSFLELSEELKADPSSFVGGPQGMMYQTMYLKWYAQMLGFMQMFSELHVAQAGTQKAMIAMHPDEDGKMSEMADHLEHVGIPLGFIQWTNVIRMKLMIEYYLMIMDMYMPMMAPMREAQRAEDVVQNSMFFQEGKPELQEQ